MNSSINCNYVYNIKLRKFEQKYIYIYKTKPNIKDGQKFERKYFRKGTI